ncbi:M10 family metallopeptidase domain-containing protein [Cellulomonas sp. SG140]|uniref:M10 family metallopeptidase domain-containing protein n=1 Tax=Cellulomonas sp. SG140 TaxID=2976536 RepID=UPI0021E90117|nr:M10 family metallopeptidase domain-containing protein [Cellulomonas sp. SG140]
MSEPPWWPERRPHDEQHGPSTSFEATPSAWTGASSDAQLDEALAARLGTRPRRRRRSLAAVLVVLLALTTVWLSGRLGSAAAARNAPPPGREEAAVPLGSPPLGAPTTGPYSFLQTQADGVAPVTYDPCRPLHYVVRTDGAPAGGDVLIATGLARISEATGLQFVADGTTTEAPTQHRPVYQPERYGRRWAPVLIAWSTPAETPELAGDVAGSAGSSSVTLHGTAHYVSGIVVLDGPAIAQLLGSANGTALAQGVVTHELAHLVGLGHVNDPTQLMNPTAAVNVTSLADGDRAGLARLGTGPCVPGL